MSVEINFSQPSTLRQFELIVEKKSIFVNAHFLAEISPYFELLCFGNFREASEGRAELEDEIYDDVVEFMQFICPDSNYMAAKKITDRNFAILAHFSHVMQFPQLRKQLEWFLENELDSTRLRNENMIDMIVEATEAAFPPRLIDNIYVKLAELGSEKIKEVLFYFISIT
uniref:BTB domain-containing protein n=1 Tax=Syphacia muris TaxID=451379 RepID=A0A0N5AT58_9BILA